MKTLRKYKLTVEDESHLTRVLGIRFNLPVLVCSAVVFIALTLFVAGMIISFTPIRTLLPGYMKENQRSETEEELMRLDSLTEVYKKDRAFIDNFLKVTDTDRNPSDSIASISSSRLTKGDTLMSAGAAERAFVSRMEENERFNVSVLSPLAAENMQFYPVSSDGIFTKDSQLTQEGKIILPGDGNVTNAADGTVIATYYSVPDRGYVVIVQHNRGFITSYSHLGSPLVAPGDEISGGQVLASTPLPDTRGSRWINVRMWHNGLPLTPYEYLGVKDKTGTPQAPKYEAPRGK